MSYGSVVGCKESLGIDADDMEKDQELENNLAWATSRIQSRMRSKGVTPPTAGSEDMNIYWSCVDLACYRFLRNRNPDKATLFREDAVTALEDYIGEQINQGVFVRTSDVE